MVKANHALSNSAQVVETSVTVNNSPIQDYVHPDDQTQPTYVRFCSRFCDMPSWRAETDRRYVDALLW